jgi:hypothetical protein
LPEAVRELTTGGGKPPPKQLSIYQNCEDIYWQLAEKGHEHTTEVVRISSQEYCIINSTPIVCQQSFLNWLELDDESEPLDAPECNFRNYANLIASFFNLPVENSIDDVEIATVVDLSFLARLRKRGDFSPGDMEQIKKQILSSESYYIPSAKMVYLGNLSLNHASEEATHFLRHICSRSRSTPGPSKRRWAFSAPSCSTIVGSAFTPPPWSDCAEIKPAANFTGRWPVSSSNTNEWWKAVK